MINLLHGDCLEQMKTLADNSVDSIVTDPPYGISFMGKSWDYDVPTEEIWREAFRVLKPGGHLLSFFGTRTYHRGVVRIEDAGFEIRDQIMWIYGSGFPKSHNIGKAIDKQAGVEREVGQIDFSRAKRLVNQSENYQTDAGWSAGKRKFTIDLPATDLAKQWDGWGTALKPANEPIVVARKPLEKGLTIAENVVKWGCGAINIDECRIAANAEDIKKTNRLNHKGNFDWNHKDKTAFKLGQGADISQGRWPANIMFDEEAAAVLDEQVGFLHGAGNKSAKKANSNTEKSIFGIGGDGTPSVLYDKGGSASRFFYVAKSSKSERNKGLDKPSSHPTVKPLKLMQYLIKLVTPPNGTVLDPFMGSGSTGVAAKSLGFNFIGCEMNQEYFEIAKKRINNE